MSVKEFTETSCKRLQKALINTENNLIDSDGRMHLTLNSLIEINKNNNNSNNNKNSSNKFTLIKLNTKPCGFDKMHVDIELIVHKFYQ